MSLKLNEEDILASPNYYPSFKTFPMCSGNQKSWAGQKEDVSGLFYTFIGSFAPLAGEKEGFQWLTSKVQGGVAVESTNFFNEKLPWEKSNF